MNNKQIRGAVREFAGRLEEGTGKLIGNRELQMRGTAKKASAKIERLAGNATEAIKVALRSR